MSLWQGMLGTKCSQPALIMLGYRGTCTEGAALDVGCESGFKRHAGSLLVGSVSCSTTGRARSGVATGNLTCGGVKATSSSTLAGNLTCTSVKRARH